MKDLYDSIGTENIDDFNIVSSKEMQEYSNKLVTFKEKLADKGDLAKFWRSFLEMCELLFNIIFATRSGHWSLYLMSLRQALPWFFAYKDLVHLEKDFPDIHSEFENGNFSVQPSPENPFGRIEADEVIETTINKDTKTPSGTTGIERCILVDSVLRCSNSKIYTVCF